jgi:hypothetical protein
MAIHRLEAELEVWLSDKPQEMLNVFQLRAALRVLPFLNKGFDKDYSKEWLPNLELRLRIIGLAWLRTVLPQSYFRVSRESEIRTLHATPLDFEFTATIASIDELMLSGIPWEQGTVINVRGISAAAAAARLHAAEGGFDSNVFDGSSFDTSWKGVEREFWSLIDTDRKMIDRGWNAKQLAESPLWFINNRFRLESLKEWNRLKRIIQNEFSSSDYWIKWYEAVLNRKISPQLENLILNIIPDLTITDENWQRRVRQLIEIVALSADDESGELIPDTNNQPQSILEINTIINPKPIEGLPSSYNFEISSNGKIKSQAGELSEIGPYFPSGRKDYLNQVKAYKKLINRLIKDLEDNKYNCREEYIGCLRSAQEEFGDGDEFENFAVIDAEIRTLIELWQFESQAVPVGLSRRFSVIIKQHYGIRAFFPGLYSFYQSINQGAVDGIAPIEALIKFKEALNDELGPFIDEDSKRSFGTDNSINSIDFENNGLISQINNVDTKSDDNDVEIPKDPLGDPNLIDYWANFSGRNYNNLMLSFDKSLKVLAKGTEIVEGIGKFIKRVDEVWPLIKNFLDLSS